jgi:hypothetical protein
LRREPSITLLARQQVEGTRSENEINKYALGCDRELQHHREHNGSLKLQHQENTVVPGVSLAPLRAHVAWLQACMDANELRNLRTSRHIDDEERH